MKKLVARYEDVVVPGESSNSGSKQSAKKATRDEKPYADLAKRAEKIAEDPFATEAEMGALEGDTKEKQKKAEDKSAEKQGNDSQASEKEAKKGLDTIVERADQTLLNAKAIFPFDLFPNSVRIDANKVDIILRTFFFSETVTSILLKEIMDVRVETALFFGKLVIDYGPHPLKVKSIYVSALPRKDALKAKEIIEGMLILYRGENIDTAKLKPEETMEEIKEVGKVEEHPS